MSLCIVISDLAKKLHSQFGDLEQNHQNMLDVMTRMPEYLAENDLAKWEADYREAITVVADESSEDYQTIDMLYELASLNLFGAFDPIKTKEVYSWLLAQLDKKGFKTTGGFDVSKW